MTPRKPQVSDVYELKTKLQVRPLHLFNSFSKRSSERLFVLDFGNFKHKYVWLVCNVDTIAVTIVDTNVVSIPYPEIQHSEPMPIKWMCEQKLLQGDYIRKNTILQSQAMVGVYKVVVIKFSVETRWPHFKIIYFISHWSLLRLCHIVLRSKYIVYIYNNPDPLLCGWSILAHHSDIIYLPQITRHMIKPTRMRLLIRCQCL